MPFALQECLLNIRRAPGLAAVSTLIVALSLIMFGVFGTIAYNVVRAIHAVREEVDMEVFLRDGAGEVERYRIQAYLEKIDGVGSVRFVSKQDALAEGRVREEYLAVLEDNPLPASYRVGFKEGFRMVPHLERIAGKLQEFAGVEEVVFGREWIAVLDKVTQTFVAVTAVMGLFILLSTGFVVSYATRLSFYARRDDVEIMRLVGATRGTVRRPFVLEGVLQGSAAGVLAMGLLYTGLRLVNPYLFIELAVPEPRFLAVLVLMGMALGFAGSVLSVRSHVA